MCSAKYSLASASTFHSHMPKIYSVSHATKTASAANAPPTAPPFAARIASAETVTKSVSTTSAKSLGAIGATMTRTARLVARCARIISARSPRVIIAMTTRTARLVARFVTSRNSNAKSPVAPIRASTTISASLAEKTASTENAFGIALLRSIRSRCVRERELKTIICRSWATGST